MKRWHVAAFNNQNRNESESVGTCVSGKTPDPQALENVNASSLAPASMPAREVAKIAAEMLRPVNQGLITVGSATGFSTFVENIYIPTDLPLLASTTQESYRGMTSKYLEPRMRSNVLA